MKYTKYLFFLFIALLVSACSDDDKTPKDRTEIQGWIEDKMKANYYWDIPSPDYSITDVKTFFSSLLSNEDGKNGNHYSYIEDISEKTRSSIQEDYSYGFEFMGVYTDDTRTNIKVLVQYIVKDSPAYDSELQRGDWITEIDGVPLTKSNYATLFGGGACKFTVERWDANKEKLIALSEKISIGSARKVEDHPVYMAKVLTTPKNNKVGYLIYNHFTEGKGDNDTSYDDKLREVSRTFKNAGVENVVLDLRYNNGGLLTSALVLSAILTSENAFGQDFAYMEYKNKSKKTYKLDRNTQLKSTGSNLNLSKLYILTSSQTASASEMIVNSLRPFMGEKNVILIGDQTEGKNVGSVPYTSNDKQWEMHPIIGKIYNSRNESDYSKGFPPDYELDEAYVPVSEDKVRIIEVLPLGDQNERLLFGAISLIDGTAIASRSTLSQEGPTYKKASINSIDRKASNGVIIND